ncbi:solute carrier family 22 member 4-like [Haliotis rubra]|uniref:solute carrier family 22 member 4-like n=1 Tax=Haliotis rubra TaxID=36100 RepID=UPI001EE50EE3|nr:solute carrier family 22 member 4-like [Haliotis rubra]
MATQKEDERLHIGIHVPSHCNVLKNETSGFESLGFQADISDLNITYHECGISITSTVSGHSEELTCIEGRQYEQPRELSLVSEWDIVCETESLGDLLQTLLMFGMGIGSVLFTSLSDTYGRKLSLTLSGLCFLATSTAMSFVPTYAGFAVMKVIQGATLTGVSLTSTTIGLEIIPTRHRSKFGIISTLIWSLSVVIYAVAAYLMRDLNWRYHQLVAGLTSGFYIFVPWMTDSLTYHGLNLNATQFHSDKYIAFGLSAITEVFSAVAFWLTVDRFGRKKTCLACHLIAAVSLITSVIFNHFTVAVPTLSVAVSTLSLIGKFGATTSFNVLYLYTPELFPTTIRNVGFGLGSLAGRVGGLFAPFSRMLYRKYPWAPGTVYGSCCIVVAILVRFLPETNTHELPQTVPEMKQWLKQQRESQKKVTIAENAADRFICNDNEEH